LKRCIEDYVENRLNLGGATVQNIYYKKGGKSRDVVSIKSDQDIPALLAEYPLKTKTGKGSRKAVMVLAVDVAHKREHDMATPKNDKNRCSKYDFTDLSGKNYMEYTFFIQFTSQSQLKAKSYFIFGGLCDFF